jgi:Tol biopolymer transport system component
VVLASALAALGLLAGPTSESAAAPLPDGRAYELVSTPDSGGIEVTPIFTPIGTQGAVADSARFRQPNSLASDGDALIYEAVFPIPNLGDSFGGERNQYLAQRTPQGWVHEYVGVPPGRSVARANIVARSDDLSRTYYWTFGGPIDPGDDDPVSRQAPFEDLYERNASGSFTWLSQGPLQPAVASEQVKFGGVSEDGSHFVFTTPRQILADAPPGVTSIYERDRTAGQTLLVSRQPGPAGTPFSGALTAHGISTDGSRIVFSFEDPNTFEISIWMREGGTTTTQVAPPGVFTTFRAMSEDGSRVFFTTDQSLDPGDTDASQDVYMFNADDDSLTLLSAGSGGTGTSEASFVDITRDGSRLYFLSPDQLDGSGVPNEPNLYERSTAGGAPVYVATLDPADVGPLTSLTEGRTRVTSDGSKLIFPSRAQLTDYDNAGHTSIYVYDSAAAEIACASCRPSGDPPEGDARLIAAARTDAPNATTDGSMIFFETADRIVAGDVTDEIDVYRYAAATGDVALISSGVSSEDSFYVSNSADGRDVIFSTFDTLVPQDQNGPVRKLYDARIGGGFPVVPAPECQGDDCHETVVPPPFASPGSENVVFPDSYQEKKPFSVAPITKKQRQKFARSCKMGLEVTANRAGTLTARAKAAIKGKTRTVAKARKQASEGATVRLPLRLSKPACQHLDDGKSLKLRIEVKMKGVAGKETIRLTLEGKEGK